MPITRNDRKYDPLSFGKEAKSPISKSEVKDLQLKLDLPKVKAGFTLIRALIFIAIVFSFVIPFLTAFFAMYGADNQIEQEIVSELPEATFVVIHDDDTTQDVFTVEMARTFEERQKGLMFRESLAPDRGMIFIFSEDSANGFWMKNTLIPLDMLFLDERGTIVDIIENVPPCEADPCPTYTPSSFYRYVVELNGGIVEEKGIAIGNETYYRPQ